MATSANEKTPGVDPDGGAVGVMLAIGRTQTSLGGTDWGMLQAGITISIIPCIGVYLLLQRYYVSGLLSGAVK
jgi:multiple sugar transport system permease protein